MGELSGASVSGGLPLFCWMEPRLVRAVRGPMASGYAIRYVVDRPLLKAARSLQTRSARPYAGIPRCCASDQMRKSAAFSILPPTLPLSLIESSFHSFRRLLPAAPIGMIW